ncbi:MAG: hypothetical protein ACAH83_03170 [Alphaproteobacteria bacterium]
MDLFKWVGRKKREEEWMRQPRRVPSFAKELPEDTDRWYVSQEFVNDEDKNMRSYVALYQPDPAVEKWRIYYVSYDLKRDEDSVHANWSSETTDPMEIVTEIRDYERKMRNSPAFISNPSEKPDYRPFANKYGIHFDDEGHIFRVQTEVPLTKGVVMNRESLETLFHREAAKKIPLDNWDGIYKGIVEKVSPEWTVTEKAFGLPENYKDVGAVPAEALSSSQTKIVPVASSVWEIAAQGGGVVNWKGGVATMPAAKEIAEAQQKLADGSAFRPAIEAAPVETPAAEAAPVEKPADPAAPVEKPLPAATPSSEAPPAEKPLPPLPLRVDGKFVYMHAREMTWGNYQEMKQLTWQRTVTMEDMAADPAYAEFASRMRLLVTRLNQLPDTLSSPTASRYDKEAALSMLARYPLKAGYQGGKDQLARQLCDANILVGMLRAGNALYKEQFGPGKKFNPEALQLISALGNVCKKFAEERLHIDAADAAKVADVISKGADPNGAALPIEKTFEKYAPPAYDPAPAPAPKAVKPAAKKKPKPSSGWWD